jgi:hypothetical protein
MSYNGWSNYETWRINLEMVDGMSLDDLGFSDDADVADVAGLLESLCEDRIEEQATGLAKDLACAFLRKVDWREIAERMIAYYA